jgi:hypothetical protein
LEEGCPSSATPLPPFSLDSLAIMRTCAAVLFAVALVAVALPLAACEDDFNFEGDKNFTGMFENAGGPPDGVGEPHLGQALGGQCPHMHVGSSTRGGELCHRTHQ